MHKLKFLTFRSESDTLNILSDQFYLIFYFHFIDNVILYKKYSQKNKILPVYKLNSNVYTDNSYFLFLHYIGLELTLNDIDTNNDTDIYYIQKNKYFDKHVFNVLPKYLLHLDTIRYFYSDNLNINIKTNKNYHIVCLNTYITNNDLNVHDDFQSRVYKIYMINNGTKQRDFIESYNKKKLYKAYNFNKSVPLLVYPLPGNNSHKILKLSSDSADNIIRIKFNQFDSISGWHLNLCSKKLGFKPVKPLIQVSYIELFREAFVYNSIKHSWSMFFNKLNKKFKNTDSEIFPVYSIVDFIANLENIENLLDMLKVIKQDSYVLSYTFKMSGYVCSISQNSYIENYSMRMNHIVYLSTLTDDTFENVHPIARLISQKDITQDIQYIKFANYIADSTKFLINHNCNINLVLESLYYDLLKYTTQFFAAQNSLIYTYHILLNSVVNLYYEQNIKLNNFYFNIFVKKMCNFVKITHSHQEVPNIKTGDVVSFPLINLIYNSYTKFNINETQLFLYCPLIVGLKDLNKVSSGFLTNASYQDALRVLLTAALKNSFEWITNLKNSVITGTMPPSGFGWLEKFIK